jgi:hypothetical protein
MTVGADYMNQWSKEKLVGEFTNASLQLAELRSTVDLLGLEIQARIQEQGGNTLVGRTHTVTHKPPSPSYDHNKLRLLFGEGVDPSLWQDAFTPEHTETKTVPLRFDGRSLNTLERKHGTVITDIMKAARLPDGEGKLTIEKKKDV